MSLPIGFGFVGITIILVLVVARAIATRLKSKKGAGGRVVPDAVAPKDATYVEIPGGIRLRYTDSGKTSNGKKSDDPTLVLVHGFFCCLETWLPLTRLIAKDQPGLRVVAVDLVGCGFSDKPRSWPYTFREQGAEVASLLEALDLTNAVLVGHSSGAIACAAAASRAPERVSGTVFVAPGFFQDKPSFLSRPALAPVANFLAGMYLRMAEGTMRKYHAGKPESLTPEILNAHVASRRSPGAQEALSAMFRSSEGPLVETLRDVGVPTHFVWSKADPINPSSGQQKIESLVASGEINVPSITSALLNDSGHWIQHEQPETLYREILDFTKTLR
uniref:AB hydrolase-1 domain-containing protein n=1 Tax=Trieres chinensis TaxID=1514140 RepID=A0A7S2A9B9_TRICV|mmetsp:Transcript_8256/g.17467  ORF Transcript_8256/g.17467 Transcript_8256/m.17467 type:complete len:332 (+) Transcript_8256:145-1140(+)|eukprot:CAMPEP_0183311090 /NCGR_PEP_ID=MMETSP0160_2-20130417/35130_1 /TAXON_ID=2839 ORGANISM="Odontella Sinensis, Strain Grunow 1884" /NCGR_SAMPLE_ID=MMETSP0160_2 /ASSEMBLY_ACC=CAM_ASM_000250 /LENGTH=331 /DNA_ID=CAMNT_0025475569 /DNA_START=74 /DNA_END=1069 /DNA_ORIENTATION=+